MKLDKFAHELCTEGKNFAAVSTLMPDGSPQVSVKGTSSPPTGISLRNG